MGTLLANGTKQALGKPSDVVVRRRAAYLGLTPPKCSEFYNYNGKRPILTVLRKLNRMENPVPESPRNFGVSIGVLNGVKSLFDKKRKIIDEVSSGKRDLVPNDLEGLKAILRPIELESLLGYEKFRRRNKGDRKLFGEMILKIANGSFSIEDAMAIKSEFGETVAAKMILLYNDRIAADGKQGQIPENEQIKRLRAEIYGLEIRRKEVRSMISLINKLSYGQFRSETDLENAFRKIGDGAFWWFYRLEYAQKVHFIEFATGNMKAGTTWSRWLIADNLKSQLKSLNSRIKESSCTSQGTSGLLEPDMVGVSLNSASL